MYSECVAAGAGEWWWRDAGDRRCPSRRRYIDELFSVSSRLRRRDDVPGFDCAYVQTSAQRNYSRRQTVEQPAIAATRVQRETWFNCRPTSRSFCWKNV